MRTVFACSLGFDEIRLRLIEEYLSPPPSAHLVRYGNTVSGAEWRELYDSIFR